MAINTVVLDCGKYEFDIDEFGLMVSARRYGEDWEAGLDLKFTGCFMAALYRIQELEKEIQ